MAMTISIDDDLKREFSDTCAQMGLSASAAFNVFAKTVVREKCIPFEVCSEPYAERVSRDREKRVRDGIWRGYQELQNGQYVTRDEYDRNRDDHREAV